MASQILRGFTYDRRVARYRDTARGQFVSRNRILDLLDLQIRGAEQRLGLIVEAIQAKNIAPAMGQMLMRDELRRLHLQNAALGAGGMDRLTFRDYGRAGHALRDTYARVTNLVTELRAGKVTLPQALNRIHGYVGDARINFLEAERDAARATGRHYEERRRLGASEHCRDCVEYASRGWQPMGVLPVPGSGSVCSSRCRCTIERREVTTEMTQARVAALVGGN